MTKFLSIFLALSCALAAYHLTLDKGFNNPYPVLCDLVASRIYLEEDVVKKWKVNCLRRSRLVTPYSKKKIIIRDMNNALGLLKVSHLEVFDSSEVQSIWQGQSLETGIESQFVDSELVVFKVHPGSPAEKAQLKKGDIIIAIDEEQPNPWEAQSNSGTYTLRRGEKEWSVKIKTQSIKRDEKINFQKLSATAALLQIPSFRAEFFSDEEVKNISERLQGFQKVVLDLRGNSGGNFVAGLRILSLFICKPEEVGRLIRPRSPVDAVQELPNTLQDAEQLAVLDNSKEVVLKTYSESTCFKGAVRVLVDSKSSSVAELVAQALKEAIKAPLYGAPSRGQMLVGVWYPLDEVGVGVQVSIPEAIYKSKKGRVLEGQGVEIDRVLFYRLNEMQAGIDSWVKAALD